MKIKKITLRLILLLAGLILLASCSNQAQRTTAPDQPTADANLIYTLAAQTIEASFKLTQDALPPTAVPTETQAPLEQPTETPEAQPTATLAAQEPSATPTNTAVPLPTATLAPAATATPPVDRAEFVSLSPSRGIKVNKNASWDMTVTVKNTGGFTWKKSETSLRYNSGEQMGSPNTFVIQKDVKPGESYSFIFTMTAPGSTGKKQVYWALVNIQGQELLYIDFDVEVVE